MTEVTDPLFAFLVEMNAIAEAHPDVTDTDVREVVLQIVSRQFVWGHSGEQVPTDMQMLSDEGNRAVAQAVKNLVERLSDETNSVPLGQARHDLLQKYSVSLENGRMLDHFVGISQLLPDEPLPADLFE